MRKFCTPQQLRDVVHKFVPASCPMYASMLQYIDKLPVPAVDESSVEEKEGTGKRHFLMKAIRTLSVFAQSILGSIK